MTRSEETKKRRGKKKILAILATGALGLSLTLVPSAAFAYSTTGCKWITPNLGVQNLVDGTNNTSLAQAISSWSSSSDVNLNSVAANQPLATQALNYGATGWEGQASWSCGPGFTTTALAKMNSWYTSDFPVARKKMVWLHELGHALGLGHATSSSSVMWTSASTAYNNGTRNPTADDIAGMNSLY